MLFRSIAIIGWLANTAGIEDKIKNKIASEIVISLRNEKDTNVQKIVNEIYSKMNNITKNIDKNLSTELNSIKEQVEKIKREKAAGKQQVASRIEQLEAHKQTLVLQKNKIQSIIANF